MAQPLFSCCRSCSYATCAGKCLCSLSGQAIELHAEKLYCPDPEKPRFGSGEFPEGWINTPLARPSPIIVPLAIPRDQWPLLARALAKLARPDDLGLGDTVARLASAVGGDTLADWYERIVGKPCGCGDRRVALNQRYPFTPTAPL
jgi:hypothetical protein